MPFTFSHPAIILPLAKLSKNWISVTGLVFGSMAPDFEYFMRMRVYGVHGHHWWGMLYFNLPVALLLAFVYHQLIKRQLILHLPRIFRSRLISFIDFDWHSYFFKRWFVVLYSILLGSLSHVFWDSWTHHDGFFASMIPFLQQEVHLFGFTLHWYGVMQHLSTIVGGLAILWVILRLPAKDVVPSTNIIRYWSVFIVMASLVLALRLTISESSLNLGTVFVSSISAGMIGLVLTPIILTNPLKE